MAACNSVRATSVLSPTSLKIAGLDANCARTSGYSIFELDPNTFVRDPNSPRNINASLNTEFGVDNGLGKIDFHIGDKNTVNGKVFIGTDTGLVANSTTITQPFWRPTVNAWTLFMGAQWNYVPSSSVVNTFRFGSNYFHQTFNTSDCTGENNGNPEYGIPFGVGGVNNDQKPNCGFTNITIQGFDGAIGCCSSFPKFYGPDHINEFIENVSILHGKHAWKFGGEARLSSLSDTGTFNRGRGQVQFRNNTFGDNSLQNFFRGYTSTGSGSFGQIFIGEPRRYLTTKAYALFVQDDYRISQRVVLNLGIRYEYITPVSEKFNRLANFDPNLGLQQLGFQTSKMWKGDNNNFAPRFGLAWDIRGNGKTVLRAGGSVIYITPGLWNQVFQQNTKNPTTGLNGNATGYATCTGLVNDANPANDACSPGIGNIVSSGIVLRPAPLTVNSAAGVPTTPQPGQVNWNQNPAIYGGNIYPGVSDAASVFKCAVDKQCTIQATSQNYKSGYVSAWSLGIQQAITTNMSLQVDYVGNHGTKLIGMDYTNTPQTGAGFCLNPDGSPYNAGQRGQVAALATLLGGTGCPTSGTTPSAVAIQASRPLAGRYPYYSFIYTVANPDFSNYDGAQVTLTSVLLMVSATHWVSPTLMHLTLLPVSVAVPQIPPERSEAITRTASSTSASASPARLLMRFPAVTGWRN